MTHTKFVLKFKRDEKGEICKHKDGHMVCGTEEVNFQEETFSLAAHYLLRKPIFLCASNWMDGALHGFEECTF